MSKYPEALLEKVARGIFTGILYGGNDAEWERELADESQYSRKGLLLCAAQDALDALGLREETRGIYRNGDGLEFVLVSKPQDYAHFNQRRFVAHTDWEDA